MLIVCQIFVRFFRAQKPFEKHDRLPVTQVVWLRSEKQSGPRKVNIREWNFFQFYF